MFLSSFISSTLFPGGSEIVLGYLASQQIYSSWLLLAVATLGNTLGAMTSWGIGRWLATKYPPSNITKPKQARALSMLQRYGSPILVLSWLPILGDPLCVVAGWLRISVMSALLWVALGKALRYIAVLSVV